MSGEQRADEIAEEYWANNDEPSSINQLVQAGEYGFAAVDGPFLVGKDGTKWSIQVPLDDDDALNPDRAAMMTLNGMSEGEAAVLIADGEAVGGGLIESIYEPEGEETMFIVVDQYAAGDPDA